MICLATYGSSHLQTRDNNKHKCVNILKVEKQFIQRYGLRYLSPERVTLSCKYLAL